MYGGIAMDGSKSNNHENAAPRPGTDSLSDREYLDSVDRGQVRGAQHSIAWPEPAPRRFAPDSAYGRGARWAPV
jgi:hypothetical protein